MSSLYREFGRFENYTAFFCHFFDILMVFRLIETKFIKVRIASRSHRFKLWSLRCDLACSGAEPVSNGCPPVNAHQANNLRFCVAPIEPHRTAPNLFINQFHLNYVKRIHHYEIYSFVQHFSCRFVSFQTR